LGLAHLAFLKSQVSNSQACYGTDSEDPEYGKAVQYGKSYVKKNGGFQIRESFSHGVLGFKCIIQEAESQKDQVRS
jgi:hypothetical protein